jgi:hypothetical protein
MARSDAAAVEPTAGTEADWQRREVASSCQSEPARCFSVHEGAVVVLTIGGLQVHAKIIKVESSGLAGTTASSGEAPSATRARGSRLASGDGLARRGQWRRVYRRVLGWNNKASNLVQHGATWSNSRSGERRRCRHRQQQALARRSVPQRMTRRRWLPRRASRECKGHNARRR